MSIWSGAARPVEGRLGEPAGHPARERDPSPRMNVLAGARDDARAAGRADRSGDRGDAGALAGSARPRSWVHPVGPAPEDRCPALGGASDFRLEAASRGRISPRRHRRHLPLREHAQGDSHHRRAAAGLPRAERPLLPHASDGKAAVDPAIAGYNFDMVSGVGYDIDLSQPVGSRIRSLRYGRPTWRPPTPSPWRSTATGRRGPAATA